MVLSQTRVGTVLAHTVVYLLKDGAMHLQCKYINPILSFNCLILFFRGFSSVSPSTRPTTAFKDFRTRCFPSSCFSPFLVTSHNKLCLFLWGSEHSMRLARGHPKPIPG